MIRAFFGDDFGASNASAIENGTILCHNLPHGKLRLVNVSTHGPLTHFHQNGWIFL